MGPGGQAGTSWRIENYLGFPEGISGADLAERARHQAQKFGAEILMLQSLIEGHAEDGQFVGTLADGTLLRARAVLVATGVDWRRLEVEGVDRLLHAGVYYGAAASEAPGVAGKDVFIVGAGNSAGQAALNFAEHARSVTILCRGDALGESMANYLVERITESPVIAVRVCTEVVGVAGRHLAADDHHPRQHHRARRRRCRPTPCSSASAASPAPGGPTRTGCSPTRAATCSPAGTSSTPSSTGGRRGVEPTARPLPVGDEPARAVRGGRRPLRVDQAGGVRRRRGGQAVPLVHRFLAER